LTAEGRGRIFVVHGMGGSGKSVLVSTFARSTSARRAFDSGVYWLDVRDETDPLRFGRALSELLAGARAGEMDIASATNHLRQALAGKRALIVIDNLTFAEAIRPLLQAMDANTRVLVTTRQAAILAGTARLVVEDFGFEEALQFLTDWASADSNIERSSLEELVSVSGRHPLALALNGAMLEKGHDLPDLVAMLTGADLQFAEDPSFDYAYSTVFKALDVSMRVLVREAPATAELFRSFPVFFWNDSVTETTVERFWAHRTGVAAPSVRRSLAELELGAFIRRESATGTKLVRLHDLWLKYLVLTGTGDSALHESLVEAWRVDGDWSRGPDDEYFLRYLVSHLIASGKRTEAVKLLTGSAAWLERLDRAFESDEPFFEQVDRVFRDTDSPGELARLHAARLVVGLRAGKFENADLAALVYAGRARQARALARLGEGPSQRLASLLVVARALAETGEASEAIVREAAREVDHIRDPRERGRAWVGLAKAWTALERFDEVLRIEQTQEEDPETRDSIWYGLSEFASAAGNFPRAFETARRIREPGSRWRALRSLARRHDVADADRRALLDAMAVAAQTVEASQDPDNGFVAHNVYWLASWGYLDEAVRQARQVPATRSRLQALSFVAGALTRAGDPRASGLRSEIVDSIGTLEREAEAFLKAASSSVAASLLVGCLDLAEQVARLVSDPTERSELLTQVALGAVQDGIFDVSERVAAELESPWSDVIRARSVEAHLLSGRPERAERSLAAVHTPESRAYALRARLKARLAPAGDLELDDLVADAAECARDAVARRFSVLHERGLLHDSPRRWQPLANERPPDEALALLLTSCGRAEVARRLADAMDEPRRLPLLREMAVLLFRAGDERARPWLDQILHEYRRPAAPAAGEQNIRATLVSLLSHDRQTALARRVAADDPWLLAHIARERAGDDELSVAWDLAADLPNGHARAAVLAELAARTDAYDPVLACERFGRAIDAVYETTDRLTRDAAFYAVAEQAARCGCLSQLAKLIEDPRRTRAASQGSTVSMSNIVAIGHAPRRLATALATRYAESGDRALAFEQARSAEDPATRCAMWTAIGATLGPTDAAAAGEAFDEAESALQKVEASGDRSDLAARLCEDLVRAGFHERGARFLKQATADQRKRMLAPVIAAFVRSGGLEAATNIMRDLDEQTDGARGVLFEAALEVRAIAITSLLELARSVREPAARATLLAKAASRAATTRSPIAGQALDQARCAVDALDESGARRTAVVELAGAFAAAGRYREAFGTLPRQDPTELIHTLAGWPDALSLVRQALPVLSWVRPDWEEFAVALCVVD
jgi:hypothetical protein